MAGRAEGGMGIFCFKGKGGFLNEASLLSPHVQSVRIRGAELRGPAAILFISRDTCSDSIANSFVLVLVGYRTILALYCKDTKEYLNQRGTKIRVFRARFRAPFLPPLFPHFALLFPLQALFSLPPLLPSSPPPLFPLF